MHPFCPTMCFFSLIPVSAVIILYSFFIYYLLSIYTIVWRDAICHFPKHFFQPLWLSSIFLLFQIVVLQPLPVTACTSQPIPISLGASLISHLPFLVLHVSLLSSVGVFVLFFSLDFKNSFHNRSVAFLSSFSACSVLHT